jgi:hypothetical protein
VRHCCALPVAGACFPHRTTWTSSSSRIRPRYNGYTRSFFLPRIEYRHPPKHADLWHLGVVSAWRSSETEWRMGDAKESFIKMDKDWKMQDCVWRQIIQGYAKVMQKPMQEGAAGNPSPCLIKGTNNTISLGSRLGIQCSPGASIL